VIDESDEQFLKASDPRYESRERGSNVIVESDLHPSKQLYPRPRTEHGTQIDKSDSQSANAAVPICESLEGDSNVTLESDSHRLKQWSHSSLTVAGMQIDASEHSAKAESPITES
jgi:hypothetical protein